MENSATHSTVDDTIPPVKNSTTSSDPLGNSLASGAIQANFSQSFEQYDTTSSLENNTQDIPCNNTEGEDMTVPSILPTDLDSEIQTIKEPEPDPESGNESDGKLARGLERNYRYSKYWYHDKQLDERKGKATRLAIQSNLHVQLVEDRLHQLEKDVRMILRLPSPKNFDDEEDEISGNVMQLLPHRQMVEHLTWAAWSASVEIPKIMLARKKWIHGLDLDATPKDVVEILIEEPQFVTRSFNWASRNEPASMIEPSLWVPSRIRFRSPLMLKLLEQITEQNVTIGPHKHQLAIIRPFKLLIAYAEKIMSFLQDLEEKDAAGLLIAEPLGPSSSSSQSEEENQDVEGIESDNNNHQDEEEEAKLKAQIESPQALVLMRLLKEVLTKDLGKTLKLRQGIELGTSQKVLFEDLWHVFRYGQEVRSPGSKQIQLYRVLRFTGGRGIVVNRVRDIPEGVASEVLKDEGYTKEAFVLECVYFDFDGTQFGPISKTFIIRKFAGEKDITSLPVYPLTLDPNHVKLRQKLLERGERFTGLSNPLKTAHKQYQGLTIDKQPEQIESQIIIDFRQAFLEMQECQPVISPIALVEHDGRETHSHNIYDYKCQKCGMTGCCGNDINFPDYEVDQYFEDLLQQEDKQFLGAFENISEFSEKQKLLLPCRVYGFALRTRKWATFDIDLVKDIEYADSWDNLVLNKTVKETVLALVKNHSRNPEQVHSLEGALSSVDLVRGKGKGLIILLHGEPGVGKTSTAECVADHTRRPLFPITCGDIGDTAESVEGNLERNFQLAHKWGCVLLLDEADVFLSRRTSSDLTRNAIVSVFLRTLEYYSGILFLTTNRVGNIDRAFKSRIHVALYYPKLDKTSTYEIWKRNIKRIKADFKREKKDFSIEEKDILRYSKEHFRELKAAKFLNWNGRQIRNAFQTAIALAEYDTRSGDKPVLSRKQFETVAMASRDFDQYLKDTQRGKDDAQLAQEERVRIDTWGEFSQNHGIVEEGIPWTPPTRAMRPSNASVPPPPRRRNTGIVAKNKGKQAQVIDEELTDDISSVTDDDDDDDAGSDAEAIGNVGNPNDYVEGSSESEEEEEEEEEPAPPPKPAKIKAKSKSSKVSKASSSKGADNSNGEGEDDQTESKAKKRSKGSALKSR